MPVTGKERVANAHSHFFKKALRTSVRSAFFILKVERWTLNVERLLLDRPFGNDECLSTNDERMTKLE